VPLFRRELAAAPFDRANSGVQLLGPLGVQHEVIETTRRIDTSHLADRDRDERADIVECLLFSNRTQRGDGEIGPIERLKHQSARPALHVRVVLEQIDGIVPQVEGPNAGAQLSKRGARTVLTVQDGSMTHDGNKGDFFGARVSQCLFHQR